MFDISFWELALIGVVALLVFGPDKLPGVARSAGLWVGKARRFVNSVKQDIDRELHMQEMQETIKKSNQNGLHQFLEETNTGLEELKKPVLPNQSTTTTNKSDSSATP